MDLILIAVLGVLFLIGCLLSAFERYALTVTYLAGLLVGGWFFYEPVHDFIAANWREVLLHQAPLYIAAGLGVAVLKWFLFVLKTAGTIRDAKETFNPDNVKLSIQVFDNLRENPEGVRRAKFMSHWNDFVGRNEYGAPQVDVERIHWKDWSKSEIVTDLLTPKAKKHVDDIAYWIFFWPFVVISTLFKDLIVKLAKHTARFFDWAFNRLSRLVISNAAKDI